MQKKNKKQKKQKKLGRREGGEKGTPLLGLKGEFASDRVKFWDLDEITPQEFPLSALPHQKRLKPELKKTHIP